ncbi:PIN domain-containing protein [Pantoea sp. A4]|uniref:PIN domain-containing protein n=1 Tax=Pantoea sp. A4 TaxID=1225184 RepID=UPI00035D8D85|nr:PIN domain-containing protein [Pantoea sp. A4]
MNSKVYLFPDTNLFIQCKPINEINWSKWNDYDEVCLIISRPVQAEIDRQKGGGNTRLAKRARATSSMFREILLSEEKYREVLSKKPIVRLYIRQDIKPDESLSDQLTYSERDDQLVGIVSSFSDPHNNKKAFLLTHDTGPMASAAMVGVEFIPIPDEWLMAPETSESDKEITKLKTEISRLKKTEPIVSIKFKNHTLDGSEIKNIEKIIYDPLTDEQLSFLVEKIVDNIPLETDFGNQEDKNRPTSIYDLAMSMGMGIEKKFIPATDEQISTYRVDKYPEWIQKCKAYLQECHKQFNNSIIPTRVEALLSNIGTRPAEDTLVTFTARGDFYISPPPYNEEKEKINSRPSLPLPPKAPRGEWETRNIFDRLANLRDMPLNYAQAIPRHKDISSLIHSNARSPNNFYYQNRPEIPVKTFSLECEQWRHQDDEEIFFTDLFFDLDKEKTSGSLEIKIHASNMADPVSESKPVKITIKKISVFDNAEYLVDKLIIANRSDLDSNLNIIVKK